MYDPEIDDKVCDNISFKARKGEILGIAGLMGAGRTELVMSLFGVWGRITSGESLYQWRVCKIKKRDRRDCGGLKPSFEDRKRYGLVLGMDVKENSTLASLEKISKFTVINTNEEIHMGNRYVKDLNIKTPTIEQKVGNLSGGNQQKVVIAQMAVDKAEDSDT